MKRRDVRVPHRSHAAAPGRKPRQHKERHRCLAVRGHGAAQAGAATHRRGHVLPDVPGGRGKRRADGGVVQRLLPLPVQRAYRVEEQH